MDSSRFLLGSQVNEFAVTRWPLHEEPGVGSAHLSYVGNAENVKILECESLFYKLFVKGSTIVQKTVHFLAPDHFK